MVILRRSLWVLGAVVALVLQFVVLAKLAPFGGLLLPKALDMFGVVSGPPQPIPNVDTSDSGPGTLLRADTMPTLNATNLGRDLKAARIIYKSTNGDTGATTEVSGAVFVPQGTPPPGGWPAIGLAHGTVGIDNQCAPSLSGALDNLAATVQWMTSHGYAVALADYQGLGTKGVHPYLDARTAGRNVIDSVRALRHTFPDVSDRWAAFGHSQGGAAAWAANEQAAIYAPELQLVGAAAMAPAADVSGMVDKAFEGRLSPDQPLAFQAIVESMARIHPNLNRDDFRSKAAAVGWDSLSDCSGPGLYERGDIAARLGAKDIAPQNQAAADQLRLLLQAWELPQRPLSAPLSVWYGGADTLVDASWTRAAIARACARGGVIAIEFQPDKGHGDFDLMTQVKWLVDRFAGLPAPNDCPKT
ncbi:MAG: lipase family protein [Mycobacterium sp.]